MTGVVGTAMTRLTTLTRTTLSLLAAGALAVLLAVLVPTGPAAAATVPIDLYAASGTTTFPGGQAVTVWGYSTTNTPVTQPGGPTLVVQQGDTVHVTLHNLLGEASSLLFQGQALQPDRTGAAAGGTATYDFVAGQAGTYLYEAGLVPNAEHQVAMGLYGVLIVRPAAAGQAYANSSTAYDDEAVILLSEIDPALNNAANPATFDMRNYAPRYFLVNGRAYPDTSTIATSPGRKVLLRYVNAGNQYHSMGVLGARQSVVALDGSPLTFARQYVAETFGPGQTADAIVTAPASPTGGTLTVYDASLVLHNTNTAGLGGMLSEIAVDPSGAGPDCRTRDQHGHLRRADVDGDHRRVHDGWAEHQGGRVLHRLGLRHRHPDERQLRLGERHGHRERRPRPVRATHPLRARPGLRGHLGCLQLSARQRWRCGRTCHAFAGPDSEPSPGSRSADVALHATGDDTSTGGSAISAAEYFIDLSFGGVNGVEDLGGQTLADPAATFTARAVGAMVRNVSDGSTCVVASFTTHAVVCAAQLAGGVDNTWAVGDAYELLADGLGTTLAVNVAAPVASLDVTIPAANVDALAEGTHVVSVHSRDSAGNWGPRVAVSLVIDETLPSTAGVSAGPSPNNGTLPVNVGTPAVRVSATVSDPLSGGVQSGIAAAEGFLCATPAVDCPVGGNGTGFVVAAVDGAFGSPTEAVYSDIPLATIAQLSNGPHTIYVHAKDAAGNWGLTASTTILIDKTPPTVVSVNRLDPDPTTAASVQFLVTFSEPVIGVTSTNLALANGTGTSGTSITSLSGSGSTRTVTVSTGPGGGASMGLNLSSATGIRDIAGNALPAFGLPFVGQVYTQPSPTLYFSTVGNSLPTGVTGTADDADVYLWNGSAFSRYIDASVAPYLLPGAANVDGFDRVDATHFYVSFSTDVTIARPGPDLTVQDEDVAFYNAGTWSVYFDGTAAGLTTANLDIDAFSIVGSTLFFSTTGSTNPPGVGGTADDADIYSWNGTSFGRAVDISAMPGPLPGAANVDGLVRVDGTHFYLSFTGDVTIVQPGPDLTVQDEDVVYYNAGTWSVFFNGTARGLTSGNLDIDAFDLP